MDTDESNILPLDKIVDDSLAFGQTELHSTMADSTKTNENEHQVHKSVGPLHNCDVPEHGECENNTEVVAATKNTDVQTTEAQTSVTDSNDIKCTEENLQDAYSTDHRHGKQLTNIYVPDTGNKWYDVKGNLVTRPIDPKKLPNAFGYLPIYGRPKSKANLADFQDEKIREFVGFDLSDQEFHSLAQYCR